MPLRGLKSK